MTGSRDPIREYLEEERKIKRDRYIGWAFMVASAVIVLIVSWAAFVWVAVTFNS